VESRGTHVISLELDFASLELDSVSIDSLLELSVFAVSELELAVSELVRNSFLARTGFIIV
jgi:hypothetical protein